MQYNNNNNIEDLAYQQTLANISLGAILIQRCHFRTEFGKNNFLTSTDKAFH